MRKIRTFQRFMIAFMLSGNLLFYLLREGQSFIAALSFSVLSGFAIYFSLTFARYLRRKNIPMVQAAKRDK